MRPYGLYNDRRKILALTYQRPQCRSSLSQVAAIGAQSNESDSKKEVFEAFKQIWYEA